MTLKNVTYVRLKDMTPEQKIQLGLDEKSNTGIVALETHNTEYKQIPVLVKRGMVNYILNGN